MPEAPPSRSLPKSIGSSSNCAKKSDNMEQAAAVVQLTGAAAACFYLLQGSKGAQKPGPYPPRRKGGPGDTPGRLKGV